MRSLFFAISFFYLLSLQPSLTAANSEKASFQYTKEEVDQLSKWKERSPEELLQASLEGDPSGLHMLGLNLLSGQCGIPINVEEAHVYFAAAASLGHAPSMAKIKSRYLEKEHNPFLSLVYVNLAASSGHMEYVIVYHEERSEIIRNFGPKIAQVIEELAMQKKLKISLYQEALQNCPNKKEFIMNELFLKKGIVGEDEHLGLGYWKSFYNK